MSLNTQGPESTRKRLALLEQHEGKASVEELVAIAKCAAAQVHGPYLAHGDYLYDDNGLPKWADVTPSSEKIRP